MYTFAVFAGMPITAADGAMGPMQLGFTGKSPRCIADVVDMLQKPEFAGWDIWYSPNHWSNEETMHRRIDIVLVPWSVLFCLGICFCCIALLLR